MKSRIRLSFSAVFACTLLGSALPAPAQSRLDTLTLIRAFTDLIVSEVGQDGDYHPPFVLTDSISSVWARAVAVVLKAKHEDLVTVPEPHSLRLRVGAVRILGDTVRVELHWSRCTARDTALNWWEVVDIHEFVRSADGWRDSGRQAKGLNSGHC